MRLQPFLQRLRTTSPTAERYWFTRFAKPVIFLTIVLALVGIYLAFTIPISVFPTTDFPRVVIGVDNGVMPIDQMTVTITRPIEESVNSVPGLISVRSITSRGAAEIDLFFDWHVDMVLTLQQVDAALARVRSELPATVVISTHRLTFASFPIIGYSLTSDSVPLTQLWETAVYDLKPRLNRLNGVAAVVVQGGEQPEFHITPSPAKLLASNVTVTDILDSVRRTNLIDSPGLLDQNHQVYLTLVSGQVTSPEQLGRVVVKTTPAGVPVKIGDVALVERSVKPLHTAVTANGKPAVLLNITRQPDSNTVDVANLVHDEVASLQRSLPPGVHLQPFYDQSEIVTESIKSVRDAILIGLVLASLIMVLFLRDWGASIVAALVIPATVLITFIVLKLLGQSFNLMTLGGLAAAVGLVIDDAIVVVENVALHRNAGQDRLEAIRSALSEMSVPLVGSTVTPIVVFLPLIAITGVTGIFFRALAITVSVSLLTSLLLALSWTPTLSQYFIGLNQTEEPSEHPATKEQLFAAEEATVTGVFRRIVESYEKCLRFALERPRWIAIFSVVLIVTSVVCYGVMGNDLLPEMDEGGFILDYLTPAGTSLAETQRVVGHIEKMILEVPEVQGESRRTGLELGLAAVTEVNRGDIAIKLKKNRSRGTDEVIAELRARIAKEEPGIDVEFVQVLQDMIGDLSNEPEDVFIKLYSSDGALLRTWAPQIASAGFTPEEVSTDAQALLEGMPSESPVVTNDRTYVVRVRFPDLNRSSLDAMTNTLLVSGSGRTATLGSLATVTELPGQTEVRRENLQRVVSVTARLEGRDLGSAMTAVRKAVSALKIPSSIRLQYGGKYEEQQKAFHDLMLVLVLAIVLVFIVLLFEFRTIAAPLAILSSAVLSTSGVLLALLATRTTFNIASFMGLIMVIGIVAKNGILLL